MHTSKSVIHFNEEAKLVFPKDGIFNCGFEGIRNTTDYGFVRFSNDVKQGRAWCEDVCFHDYPLFKAGL